MAQSLANNPSTPPASIAQSNPFGAPFRDKLFQFLTGFFALSTALLIMGIALALFMASRADIAHSGFSFFTQSKWDPTPVDLESGKKVGDLFGALPFIYGTLLTSAIALL